MEELKPDARVLVIQTAFIGDAILTLPAIQHIKTLRPAAEIDVVAIPSTADVFRRSPSIRETLVLDKRGAHRSLWGVGKFARALRRRGYDELYAPHRSFRTAFAARLSGAPVRVGFDRSAWRGAYTRLVRYREDWHEVRRDLSLVPEPPEEWRIRPEIRPTAEEKARVAEFFKEWDLPENAKIVACAPGSVWETKRYPVSDFNKILRYLAAKDFRTLVVGSPQDRALGEEATRGAPGARNAAGIFTIAETIEALARCRVVVANDSAPTHFGVAADVPTLTLYCSTTPAFGFYPYHDRGARLSVEPLECKPCGVHGLRRCPIGTFECARRLTPERVIEKLKETRVLQ
jgi:heptosyltransferase II